MDKLTLRELKTLVKDHVKAAPKMSAGKQSLLLYADKNGLIKKKEAPVVPVMPVKSIDVKKVAKVKAELPEILQKPETPIKKVKVAEPVVPVKKAPTGFAAFLSANKGKGLKMAELSQMYRDAKEQL
jgi:hypothetical protein